jgi:hypothetical protein
VDIRVNATALVLGMGTSVMPIKPWTRMGARVIENRAFATARPKVLPGYVNMSTTTPTKHSAKHCPILCANPQVVETLSSTRPPTLPNGKQRFRRLKTRHRIGPHVHTTVAVMAADYATSWRVTVWHCAVMDARCPHRSWSAPTSQPSDAGSGVGEMKCFGALANVLDMR